MSNSHNNAQPTEQTEEENTVLKVSMIPNLWLEIDTVKINCMHCIL